MQTIISNESSVCVACQSNTESSTYIPMWFAQPLNVKMTWFDSRRACTVRAPVFGRHQFFGTSEHYGKAHGSLLSGWMNYNYTGMLLVSYIQQYINTSITVLTNQVWKLLIALFEVPNTGAFAVRSHLRHYSCLANCVLEVKALTWWELCTTIWGAVVAQWIRPWTLRHEVPGSNLPAASVMPLGKAHYPLPSPLERT